MLFQIFERCELAKTLRFKFNTPLDQLPTWMCIAFHESGYNTKAYNSKTHDYGIFQINEKYWCNVNPGDHKPCGVKCKDLFSDDITNSVKCSRIVYNEFKRAHKDPFSAWVAYNTKCKKEGNLDKYIKGCFRQILDYSVILV